MSFARSDVRKDNSFRNAKAPLLQKIFHLLSTTAIFCLLSVVRVWPGVYRPRAVLASASRLGARLPAWRPFAVHAPICLSRARRFLAWGPRWPSLRARTPFWGLRARRSLAWGPSGAIPAGSHPVLGPASPSPLGAKPLGGHLCGLAPRFGPASPSLLGARPLWGHPCGLAPCFGAREPVAPWRGVPLGPSLRARTPFWGPRARRSLAWGPSGAISVGSQICGYEVCRAGGGGARGAEPASGWRRDVFSSLGGP